MSLEAFSMVDVILGDSPTSAVRGIFYGMIVMTMVQWRGWFIFGKTAKLATDLAEANAKHTACETRISEMEEKIKGYSNELGEWRGFKDQMAKAALAKGAS